MVVVSVSVYKLDMVITDEPSEFVKATEAVD